MGLAGVPSPGFLQLKGPGLRRRQPASRLRAWGRATDSIALQAIPPWFWGPRGTLLPTLRNRIPTLFSPVEGGVQERRL